VVGLLVVVASLLVVLGSGLWWHTLRLASRQHPEAGHVVVSSSSRSADAAAAYEAVAAFERQLQRDDPNAAVERLAESVRFRTISHESNHADSEEEREVRAEAEKEFDRLLTWLERTYTRVFATLRRTKLDCHSLILEWPGRDRRLKPFLLASHMDVVPVDPETEAEWLHPPFSGDVADGFVWGRGTLDDKVGVVGILEAVEALIGSGFEPRRTLYLAFGHDEEVSGLNGALKIVHHFRQRNLTLEFVLDEGGSMTSAILKQVSKNVALVGIAEKGYLSAELVAHGPGGHSSMPTAENPIGILAQAVAKLYNNPMPASISGAVKEMLEFLAPDVDSLAERVVLSNLWLFSPVVTRALDRGATASSIRTSSALTRFNAGVKDNVLPKKATATINFRILPGETPADCVAYINRTVNDPRVEVSVLGDHTNLPSPVSPTDSLGWHVVQSTIHQLFPEVVVAPYLTMGATDGRYYHALTDNVYRFIPYVLGDDDLARIHGVNERVAVSDVTASVKFYGRLIINAQAEAVEFEPRRDEL